MQIKNFTIENYKGVKRVDITPSSNTIIIMGKNGAGKSSIIDGIKNLFAGKDKLIKRPIREGEEKAVLTADLGDYEIKRIFTDKTDRLEIKSKDGSRFSSPQALMDKLTGGKTFDPNEFSQKSESEQRQTLLEITGLNLLEYDNEISKLKDDRLIVGRERDAIGVYAGGEINEYIDKEIISVSKASDEFQIEKQKHSNYEQTQINIKAAEAKIIECKNTIITLEKEIEEYKKIEKPESNLVDLSEGLVQLESLNEKIRNAKQIKEKIDARRNKEDVYAALTNKIQEIEKNKKEKLEAVEMPLEGLELTDDGVLLNGVPLSQLSTSEKLKVGISMYITQKPELAVLFIKNGNDLDDENMKIIGEMADKYEIQILIERIDSDGQVGFYIEGGELKT